MKVKPRKDEIFLEAETDFEGKYLQNTFGVGKPVEVFVKCGLTPADVLGLVIRPKKDAAVAQ